MTAPGSGTVVERVAAAHRADSGSAPLRAGDFVTVRPRHVLTHDNTAAVLIKFRNIFAGLGEGRVSDPDQPVFALDHEIQNESDAQRARYGAIEDFARAQGVAFHPPGSGIGHQHMLERGFALPGALVVASDSHANIYGALGAVGTPVVRTDAAALWATGACWWQVPPTVQVTLEGALRPGVTGKDIILTLCGLYRDGEALNAAVEFAGPGVARLDMASRMTIANMTTEWGALVGWFPVDEVTIAYLEQRRRVLEAEGATRIGAEDIARWREDPPRPHPDAHYAMRITLDLSEVAPVVAGPDAVDAVRPIAEVAAEDLPVHKAYLVSCVNSRLEDLREAAEVLRGERVADGVELYIAAASREVEEAARADGSWAALVAAGARTLPSGCGPCIGLGAGLLAAGEVGISATNRNFKGRMGSRDARCFLASPRVVAASARAGRITAPEEWSAGLPARRAPLSDRTPTRGAQASARAIPAAEVEILDGFPERVQGRWVLLPRDGINTDGIYGKEYTYREDVTREEMARVVLANYDPTFAERAQRGDILVAGWRFGTGSSREQAVTALAAAGIPLVIAASFSQTYLRNAFNNGFPCIACPELVEALRARHAASAEPPATVIPGAERTATEQTGSELIVDFRHSVARLGDESFTFPPLGTVPQALVVAGGVEEQIRERLASGSERPEPPRNPQRED